jgi:hypothetical protein
MMNRFSTRFFTTIFVLFQLTYIANASDINKEDLRKKFYLSVESSSVAKAYIKELTEIKTNSEPLVKGYLAATCMVMAKHAYNPYSKFKYFIDGKNELETSIAQSPDHIELRLIRFAIQTNAPFFLGYSEDIKQDKAFLIKNFSSLDRPNSGDLELKKIIKTYLTKSGLCTKDELALLSN